MRVLGVFAVVLGCGALGLVRCAALNRRVRCLRDTVDALRTMASELESGSPPMPELVEIMEIRSKGGVRKFFSQLTEKMDRLGEESFQELWSNASESSEELFLNSCQRRLLAEAGACLGRYSVLEQGQALRLCAERLEREYLLANEKAMEGKKLYPGLGLTAGIMLSAVLL